MQRSKTRNQARTSQALKSQEGFSLVEMLVVVAILAILALYSMSAIEKLMVRNKLEAVARHASVKFQEARQEAILRGFPVVVEFDVDNQQLFGFADIPARGAAQGDLVYTAPDGTSPHRSTDYEVFRLDLPIKRDSSDAIQETSILMSAGDGGSIVKGFSSATGSTTPCGATGDCDLKIVFDPDGSVRDTGSFFVGDFRDPGNFASKTCGNCFEVEVAPAATARVRLKKYDHDEGEYRYSGRKYSDTNQTEVAAGHQWVWY